MRYSDKSWYIWIFFKSFIFSICWCEIYHWLCDSDCWNGFAAKKFSWQLPEYFYSYHVFVMEPLRTRQNNILPKAISSFFFVSDCLFPGIGYIAGAQLTFFNKFSVNSAVDWKCLVCPSSKISDVSNLYASFSNTDVRETVLLVYVSTKSLMTACTS